MRDSQAPNHKHQFPNNNQNPMTEMSRRPQIFWPLEFGHWKLFGNWNLGIGI
jgi:hypothetical protein